MDERYHGRSPALFWLLFPVVVAAAMVLAPEVALALVGLNLVVTVLVLGGQAFASYRARRRAHYAQELYLAPGTPPFVSIHVPICNEPPEIVASTLESLARLRYDRYEVIVIDNNTSDARVWRPVEAYCRRLGSRFRFRHVDRLQGAKAGALELCRSLSSPETELVLVLDSDYRVSPQLLRRAVHYLTPSVSWVQFPQAYSNGTEGCLGLSDEYGHYFDLFAQHADESKTMLLTGPLCLIRLKALEAAGGWASETVTEDAELGVRLVVAGFRGRYAPEVRGRGLMPTDLATLRRQRRRWVFGNAQTLRSLRWRHLRALGARRAVPALLQLTAWFDFLLVPLTVLALSAILPMDGTIRAAATLAALTVGTHLALKLTAFAAAPPLLAGRTREVRRAFLVHLGMLWEGMTAWIEALLGKRIPFERTCKEGHAGSLRDGRHALIAGAALLAAAVTLALRGEWLLAAGAFISSLALTSVIYLQRELAHVTPPSFPHLSALLPLRPSRPSTPAMEDLL